MSARIIINVLKAHQDKLMNQKSTGLAQATAAILEGEERGGETNLPRIERETLVMQVLLEGTPGALRFHAYNITLGCMI